MYSIFKKKNNLELNSLLFIVVFSLFALIITIFGSLFNRIQEFESEKNHLEQLFRNFIIQDIKHNILQNKALIENYVNLFKQKEQTIVQQSADALNFIKTLHNKIYHGEFFINYNNDVTILNKEFSLYLENVKNFLLYIKNNNDYNMQNPYIFHSQNILYIFIPLQNQNSLHLGYLVSLLGINNILDRLGMENTNFYLKFLDKNDQSLNIKNNITLSSNIDIHTRNNNLFQLLISREKISLKNLIQNKYYKLQSALTFRNSTIYYEIGFILSMLKEKILKDILFNALAIIFLVTLYYYPSIHRNLIRKFNKKNLETRISYLEDINLNQSKFLSFLIEEIKKYLNFILTGSEIIKEELMGKNSEIYKRYATAIHSNAQNILHISNKTLKDQQLINKEFKIQYSVNNLSNLIQELIKNKKRQLQLKKQNIDLKFYDLEKQILILCDLQLFTKVLNDLINIMIECLVPNNQSRIVLKCTLKLKNELLIKIENTSDSNYITHIQIDSKKSCGMTLNIIKIILDAHNIQLKISTIEKNTEINILIPRSNLLI